MYDDIDYVIVNLNILSSLEPNKKLISKENFINVEQSTFIPEYIRRRWRGDSRDETIKKIETIINKAIELKSELNIKKLLENSKKGLLNLKQTYSTCELTKARIDSIILKIDNINNQ